MSNLRIIHNNAADKSAISASSTAGALVAANMLTDYKGQVHRSVGTTVTYTLAWFASQAIGGVAIPACNLTADATIRVVGYTAGAGGTVVMDSGPVLACPGMPLGLWDWTQPLNANAFAYGGAAKTSVWFAAQPVVKRLEITLTDTNNAAGYIDCARLVVGGFWEPQVSPGFGITLSVEDATKNTRNDSGDFLTDRAAMNDAVSFRLEQMDPSDRAEFHRIIRSCGVHRPILVAVEPDDDDPLLKQDSLIYGKRENSPMSFTSWNRFDSGVTLQGW